MLIGTRRSLLGSRFVDDLYSKRIQEFSDNLVAHWPLDDRAGAVAIDRTGRNNGDITGTTLGQSGIGDGLKSQYFDGTNDFIDISAIASNLILNGGFETVGGGGGDDVHANWTEHKSDGAIANETGTKHTGSDALKLTAGAGKDTYDDQNVTVVAGSTNKIRLWVYGDGSDEGQYNIYDNTNTADIVALTGIGETAAAWAMVDIPFDAPATCTSVRVRLQCPDASGGVVYFDTVSVRRTDIPTFDPHEGSLIVWAEIASAVWTDSTERFIVYVSDPSAKERLMIYKTTVNGQVSYAYEGNDVIKAVAVASGSPLGWTAYGLTWSLSGDKFIAYYNGAQTGSTQTGLGTWNGILGTASTVIGAKFTTPADVAQGNLAHGQLYNTPHSVNVMAYLMRRPS